MDMIAERLGMDPVAFRLKNTNQPGDVTPCGWQITTCAFDECIEKAVAALGPVERGKGSKRRGVGIAGAIGVSGSYVYADGDYTEAAVEISESGTATVRVGTTDIGTWSNTTLAQVAAEELGVPFADVRMVTMDTDLAPRDLGSFASRVAFVGGNAVRLAAAEAKRQVLESVAMKLETVPDKLRIEDRMVYVEGQDVPVVSIYDAVQVTQGYRTGQPVVGRWRYQTPADYLDRKTGYANVSAAYSFLAQAVEVEVDCETGRVTVLRLIAAYDLGQALNPLAVEGQIEGALAQGIGYALTEQMIHENGRLINPNFLDYRILTAPDMPPVQILLVGSPDPAGPFGAKGVGEWGLVPTAPAIANAIHNAVGVRVSDLPITPEKVLSLLLKEGALAAD
jgi:CO/xanthine dehydrogenase Mo-binding subunit